MNCPACSAQMKPLFTGFYCPKDCDKVSTGPDATSSGPSKVFMFRGKQWRVTLVKQVGKSIPSWRANTKFWHDPPLHEMTQAQFDRYAGMYFLDQNFPGLKISEERTDAKGECYLWMFEKVS